MAPSLLTDPVRRATRLAREALYVTVGTGVLAVQRLQVQRREWEQQLERRFSGSPGTTTG
jgi:hypothetical protein